MNMNIVIYLLCVL